MTRLRHAGCVFAEDEARLLLDAAGSGDDLDDMVERRVAGEPLEQVLGWAEFCGLRITVQPGVFVPRRRTQLLVRQALALLRHGDSRTPPVPARPRVVVDLCCGSAAVGAAILAGAPAVELYAADVDPAAVRCARRNVPGERVHEGDLYEALPASLAGHVDILVVNAPYVPTDDIPLMPPEARLHEARLALDGGPDGVDVQRRVVAGAARWLVPGGHLLVETSARQVPRTVQAFTDHGFVTTVARSRALSATVVIGTPAADARHRPGRSTAGGPPA